MIDTRRFYMNPNFLHSYHFGVLIQGNRFGFQEVSGIAREMETETYQEGGRNDMVHLFPKRVHAAGGLVLKKGICAKQAHPFYLIGEHIPSMTIEVYGNDGKTILKTYLFSHLVISKWEVSALHAQQNELLIDTFTLTYQEINVLS